MKETYVHTLGYRYSGRRQRRSRTMSPISYGPFEDAEAAREWIRYQGINYATTLMSLPARENIEVTPDQPAPILQEKYTQFGIMRTEQNATP